jgi:hypothetical protein
MKITPACSATRICRRRASSRRRCATATSATAYLGGTGGAGGSCTHRPDAQVSEPVQLPSGKQLPRSCPAAGAAGGAGGGGGGAGAAGGGGGSAADPVNRIARTTTVPSPLPSFTDHPFVVALMIRSASAPHAHASGRAAWSAPLTLRSSKIVRPEVASMRHATWYGRVTSLSDVNISSGQFSGFGLPGLIRVALAVAQPTTITRTARRMWRDYPRRGSSGSRRPSPKKFSDSTVTAMVALGKSGAKGRRR